VRLKLCSMKDDFGRPTSRYSFKTHLSLGIESLLILLLVVSNF
jgi:hypothetical protein